MPSDWSAMESSLQLVVEGLGDCLLELGINLRRVLLSVSSIETLVNKISSSSVVRLSIDWTCTCKSSEVQEIISKLKKLKKLCIPLKNPAVLQSVCKSLDLDCLVVSGLRAKESRLKAVLPLGRHLISLSLVNCHLEDDDILAINDHLTDQLLLLNIRQNHVGDISVKDICGRQTKLTSLDVSMTDVTSNGIKMIAKQLTYLTYLCVNGCCKKHNEQFVVNLNLKNLCHLQHFQMSGCDLVSSLSVSPDAPLMNLNLSACIYLEDWRPTSTLSCLQSLNISNCASLSKKVLIETMLSLGNYSHSLTSLNVSCLTAVSDEVLLGLEEIPKQPSQLKVHSDSVIVQSSPTGQQLKGNRRLSSAPRLLDCAQDSRMDRLKAGIVHRLGIMSLTNLKKLCLKGCSRITDTAVSKMLQFPLLTELDLSDLYLVTESGLTNCVTSCPLLERLYLSSCHQLGNGAAEQVAQHCKRLTHFGVAYTEISDSGVSILATGLCHLFWVDLSFCTKVTAQSIELLKVTQPCLLVLHARHLQVGDTLLYRGIHQSMLGKC
jgi:hypothetical protein